MSLYFAYATGGGGGGALVPALGAILGSGNSYAAVSSQAMTVAANAAVGEMIMVSAAKSGGGTITGVTDSKGNRYKLRSSVTNSGRTSEIYTCTVEAGMNLVSGVDTITMTTSASGTDDRAIGALTVTGATTFDIAGTQNTAGFVESPTIVSSAPGYAIAVGFQTWSGSPAVYTPSEGWTILNSISGNYFFAHRSIPVSNDYTTNGSWSLSTSFGSTLATVSAPATQVSVYATNSNASSSINLTLAAPLTNGAIVVLGRFEPAGGNPTCTFDGTPMTFLGTTGIGGRNVYALGLAVGNKAAGTYTAALTISAYGIQITQVIALNNVNQINPFGAYAWQSTAGVSSMQVNPVSDLGDLAIGISTIQGTAPHATVPFGPDQTSLFAAGNGWSASYERGSALTTSLIHYPNAAAGIAMMGFAARKAHAAGSYPATVLVDAPVGYWRLGDSTGTVALDASGNGNNGTYQNTPTLYRGGAVAGDAAVLFTRASNHRVALAQPAILRITGQCTIECWYKPTTFPTGTDFHAIIERGYNAGNGKQGFCLRVNGNSGTPQISVGSYESSTSYGVNWTITNWSPGEWKYIAAGYDGTNWKIFINGVEVASAVQAVGAVENARDIYIGCLDQGFLSDHANGTIDEVALYDTWIGAPRIAAHYLPNTITREAITGQSFGSTRSDSYWVGTRLIVGAANVTVTHLGRWKIAGNTGTHVVHIRNHPTGTIVASVSIDSSLGVDAAYQYVALSSTIVLSAGGTYYLMSQEMTGDTWHDAHTATVNAAFASGMDVYSAVSPGAPSLGILGRRFAAPNLKFI